MGEGLELKKRGDKSAGSVLGKRIPGAMGMVPWWSGDKSACVCMAALPSPAPDPAVRLGLESWLHPM